MAPPVDRTSGSAAYYDSGIDSNDRTDTVQLGETSLTEVAKRLNLDPDDLLLANPQINDPYKLSAGQEINVPRHESSAPAPPQTASTNTPKPTSTLPKGDSLDASFMKATLNGAFGAVNAAGNAVQAVASGGSAAAQTTAQPVATPKSGNIDAQGRMKYEALRKYEEAVQRYESTGKMSPILKDSDADTIKNHGYIDAGPIYALKNSPEQLKQYLTDLNGGKPLTDFEKQLVNEFGKKDDDTTITPILHMAGDGVQAYAVTKGGSGDRVTNYYDSEGKKLAGPFHHEAGLVNEGLGPIPYILGGFAAKGLIGGLLSRARAWITGEAVAGAAAKGMVEAEGEEAASTAGETSGNTSYGPKVKTEPLPKEPSVLKEPPIEEGGPFRNPPGNSPSPKPSPDPAPAPTPKDPWSTVEPSIDKTRKR